jgi:hypothetical protein
MSVVRVSNSSNPPTHTNNNTPPDNLPCDPDLIQALASRGITAPKQLLAGADPDLVRRQIAHVDALAAIPGRLRDATRYLAAMIRQRMSVPNPTGPVELQEQSPEVEQAVQLIRLFCRTIGDPERHYSARELAFTCQLVRDHGLQAANTILLYALRSAETTGFAMQSICAVRQYVQRGLAYHHAQEKQIREEAEARERWAMAAKTVPVEIESYQAIRADLERRRAEDERARRANDAAAEEARREAEAASESRRQEEQRRGFETFRRLLAEFGVQPPRIDASLRSQP